MPAPKGNKFALGCTTNGRPPKFESEDDLIASVQGYFNHCEAEQEKITITGLALFLGFESRQSLNDYFNREEFYY